METVEFEEKEYESALYNQLASSNIHLWSPGQVLESYLGFDAALLVDDPFFGNFTIFADHLGDFRHTVCGLFFEGALG